MKVVGVTDAGSTGVLNVAWIDVVTGTFVALLAGFVEAT
jgi:hypothetical protein